MNEAQALEAKNLRTTFGQFPSGVAIVTCRDDLEQHGMTISSFSSVSISPALVSWSIRKESSKLEQFSGAQSFAFSILRNDQMAAAKDFAKGDPKAFQGHPYTTGANGSPLIEHAISHIECRNHAVYDGGDHLIILGHITRHERFTGKPLVFSQGQFCETQEITPTPNPQPSPAACAHEYMHLLPLLRNAESRISDRLAAHRHHLQLNPISARILTLLSDGPQSKEYLDASINADPSTIDDQINEMLNSRLLTKQSNSYSATTLGLERRKILLDNAQSIYADELQEFSAPEIRIFTKILNQLGSD